jgi:hypothetical protein
MSNSRGVPLALRVFACSLIAGLAGGYGAYRLGFYLAQKFLRGEYAEVLAVLIAIGSALAVGVASAVTAGVLAGRAAQSKSFNV